LQGLAASGNVIFANRRAERNALTLGWTVGDIGAFVCGLQGQHHRGKRPNCSIFDGRDVIDVDKYGARVNEETLRITLDRSCCEFFVELAMRSIRGYGTVLIVSFHLDGQP
jgi:hypothetical protein